MNKRSAFRTPHSAVLVVGGGPAGSSLAIRLAKLGLEVTLFERERFPREKLCGEFISPECFRHFEEFGVLNRMLAAGGDRIFETRFYSQNGRKTIVPTDWFGGSFSLSLSRSVMDNILLERARAAGVTVIEEASAVSVRFGLGRISALTVKHNGMDREFDADIFVDATGRARILSKLIGRQRAILAEGDRRPGFVGFKAHLTNAAIEMGTCEIYSIPGGYGGLSNVEDGLANLCLIVRRDNGLDANAIFSLIGVTNSRAAVTLADAAPTEKWHAVAVADFGSFDAAPAENVFSVGDSAGFIDPFTGSGMLMAFESSELLAASIERNSTDLAVISGEYLQAHRQNFKRRFAVSRLLRRAAFSPLLAEAAVAIFGFSRGLSARVARSTRQQDPHVGDLV